VLFISGGDTVASIVELDFDRGVSISHHCPAVDMALKATGTLRFLTINMILGKVIAGTYGV